MEYLVSKDVFPNQLCRCLHLASKISLFDDAPLQHAQHKLGDCSGGQWE